jgi:hypothetical protein
MRNCKMLSLYVKVINMSMFAPPPPSLNLTVPLPLTWSVQITKFLLPGTKYSLTVLHTECLATLPVISISPVHGIRQIFLHV